MSEAVRRYLAEETTAFDFDDEIFEIKSDDPTIDYIRKALWMHYDDVTNHTVVLTKEGWDYFHRLMLVLQSNAQIEVTRQKRWSLMQLIPLIGIVVFGVCAYRMGISHELLAVTISLGIIAMLWTRWSIQSQTVLSRREIAMTPFSSITELSAVRRSVPGFAKTPYPPGLHSKRIRSPFMGDVMQVYSCAVCLVFSLWSYCSRCFRRPN